MTHSWDTQFALCFEKTVFASSISLFAQNKGRDLQEGEFNVNTVRNCAFHR